MKAPLITRRCSNCGIDTHRGMFCTRCDRVLYIAWMLADFHKDPEIRLKFLQEQSRERITCGQDIVDIAEKKGATRLKWLGKSVKRHCYKLSLDAEKNIYARAMRVAESQAKAEIEVRDRAYAEMTEGVDVSMADELAEKALQAGMNNGNYSRKNPEWTADYSKNQKAYAGFTAAESEPEILF